MNVLYPVFAMSALTLYCIFRLGYLRYQAVRAGEVDPRYFSLYRGFEEPDKLAFRDFQVDAREDRPNAIVLNHVLESDHFSK